MGDQMPYLGFSESSDTSLIAIPDTCGTRMPRTYKRRIAAFKKG
jgi:hypothetical protein